MVEAFRIMKEHLHKNALDSINFYLLETVFLPYRFSVLDKGQLEQRR